MKFLQIGLEDETEQKPVDLDPNETAKAIAAVDNQESTEPAKVLQVANYKEELTALRAQSKKENTEDTTDENSTDSDGAGTTSSDNDDRAVSGSDDIVPQDDDQTGDTAGDATDTQTVEQTPGTVEMGEEAPGKTDAEVAQEEFLVQGYKMALEALDSIQEMAKYQGLIKKRSKLGGVSPETAKIIFNALESNSTRCGYVLDKTKVPSLESFGSYSGAEQSTRDLSIAVEGFLNDTWEAIKKFFKSIWKWIMDLLSGKKNGTPDSIARPQTKPNRDAAIKDLEKKIDDLKANYAAAEKLREKDKANGKAAVLRSKTKLSASVAKALFKNSDRGTLEEAFDNGAALAVITQSFTNLAKFFEKQSQGFTKAVLTGETNSLSTMMATKDILGSIAFDELEVLQSSFQLLMTATTDEIAGGVRAQFTVTGPNKGLYQITNAKATTLLGKQGLTFVSDKGTQKDFFIPEFNEKSISDLKIIVPEIKKCYASIDLTQQILTAWVKIIKDHSEASNPPTWDNLEDSVIADLKSQTMLVGALELSMAAGYKKLENQVNVFKDGVDKLLYIYSK